MNINTHCINTLPRLKGYTELYSIFIVKPPEYCSMSWQPHWKFKKNVIDD